MNRGKMPLPQGSDIFCAFSAGATSSLHGVSNEVNKGDLSLWERLPAAIPSACTYETGKRLPSPSQGPLLNRISTLSGHHDGPPAPGFSAKQRSGGDRIAIVALAGKRKRIDVVGGRRHARPCPLCCRVRNMLPAPIGAQLQELHRKPDKQPAGQKRALLAGSVP